MMSLFNLFSCLNNVPKALTQALQPYLERAHIWEHLYTLAGKVTELGVTSFQSCVLVVAVGEEQKLLQMFIRRTWSVLYVRPI